MSVNLKEYAYTKGTDDTLDAQFSAAASYARVKLGQTLFFWKAGFRWYCIPLSQVRQIYRRVQPMHGRLCAGGHSFLIEWLAVILTDGTELEVYFGSDVDRHTQAFAQAIKDTHPEIKYGKDIVPCSES